jgi:hypothetical protein
MHEPQEREPGETVQPAHRRNSFTRTPARLIVEGGIMMGTMAGVAWLTVNPLASLLSPQAAAPPQQQLTYGGAAYALAILAALLYRVVHRLPYGPLYLFLFSLVLGIIFFPTVPGSILIAAALARLTGWRLEIVGIVLIGLLLWAIVAFGSVFHIALTIARGTRVHA